MNYINKVAAIHDISCFGRASITTIIPILSAMEIQVCPLPTAIFSTHMGGFGKPAEQDLNRFLYETKEHWENLNLDFQCIYSGYLATDSQVDFVERFINSFINSNTLVVIDPVMGDNGVLYSSMNINMIEAMRDLIKCAQIITPNLTEAAFLLNEEYKEDFKEKEIEQWLKRLSDLGPNKVIITSVPSEKGVNYIDTVAYDSEEDKFIKITNEKIDNFYPGTGDAFTSTVIGYILNGENFYNAIKKSCDFISYSIEYSSNFDYPNNYGILLEKTLYKLKNNDLSKKYI